MKYPNFEFSTGRNIRMSPIYPRLKAAGAVFSQSMGYERPCYFQTNKAGNCFNVVIVNFGMNYPFKS